MIPIEKLLANIDKYINTQLSRMTVENPIVGFFKPLITRAYSKNFNKMSTALKMIADEEGNIDAEGILQEMISNVVSSKPFIVNTSFMGPIEIGGGNIKLNIPFINKILVLNSQDLDTFKEMLISKSE